MFDTESDNGDLDDSTQSLEYLKQYNYQSKDDIIFAVAEYHTKIERKFVVTKSDKRRYYVKCAAENCRFYLNYNFRNEAFCSPSSGTIHTCSMFEVPQSNKTLSVKYLIHLPEVKTWFEKESRNATTACLKRHLNSIGIDVPYHTLLRTFCRLKMETFVSDAEQYQLLQDYVVVLEAAKHHAVLETDNSVFKRLFILFREGIQSFAAFHERGLQLDGTFLKSNTGGILFVACVKDSNNNIRIVGIGVMNSECYENWQWFLHNLKQHLSHEPAFIMSDRDKGLARAVDAVYPGVHHGFCFRHVLENFNVKFKNKKLKDSAWSIAKACTQQQLDAAIAKMGTHPDAIRWLQDIGLEKLTLLKSPVCRFGMVTSNNVESVNSRLLNFRKWPIMELLLNIERMVVTDRQKQFEKLEKWRRDFKLTMYAEKWLHNVAKEVLGSHVTETSPNDFFVKDSHNKEYVVSTSGSGGCTCNVLNLMKLPCSHLVKVIRHKDLDVYDYCGDSWGKELYKESCAAFPDTNPVTIIENLTAADINPPAVHKGRGRPKKRRIESQAATQELDAQPRRQYRCSQCQVIGHNKRQCRQSS